MKKDRKKSGLTSLLTWDEIVYIIKKARNIQIASEKCRKFLEFPNLKLSPVTENVLSTAQKILEKYSLNPRDAIHIATALTNGIKDFVSDDSDFNKIKEIKRVF